jgi:excisionase family DNA binding protein
MKNYMLLSVSLDELKTYIREAVKESLDGIKQPEPTQYFYSIKELASFLQCSTTTIQKLKNSGKIRFKQFGRKCVFSSDEVLEDIASRKLRYANLRHQRNHQDA